MQTEARYYKQHMRSWRVCGGAVVLLILVVNSTKISTMRGRDVPELVGSFLGLAIGLSIAIWLIASGLPKTMGLDGAQKRARLKNWLILVASGNSVLGLSSAQVRKQY